MYELDKCRSLRDRQFYDPVANYSTYPRRGKLPCNEFWPECGGADRSSLVVDKFGAEFGHFYTTKIPVPHAFKLFQHFLNGLA